MLHLLMVMKVTMQAVTKKKIIGADDDDSHSVFVVASIINDVVNSVIDIGDDRCCLGANQLGECHFITILQTNKLKTVNM